jgi:hypothetical protein
VSGETEAAVSGWTVDTLHEHFSAQLETQRTLEELRARADAMRQQLTDERDAIEGKIVDNRDFIRLQILDQRSSLQQQITDLRTLFGQQVTDMRTLLNERYDTQTKALDAAFKAAEQAVQTALVSAEKAVGKAETAADKRFESVNEFRKQLADQTATFPTRIEVTTRMDGMAADTLRNSQRIGDLELRLTSRLDTAQGRTGGEQHARTEQRLNANLLVGVVALLLTAVIIAVAIWSGAHGG